MNLKGKRIAILAENLYQEMELWVPYYRMKEEGAEVKVVGAGGARSYTSKHGYPVTVDVQADAVTAVEFDAVIVPGGYAPRHDASARPHGEAGSRSRSAGQGGRGYLPRRVDAGQRGCGQGQEGNVLLLDQGRHGECGWSVVGQRGGCGRQSDHFAEARRSPRLLP